MEDPSKQEEAPMKSIPEILLGKNWAEVKIKDIALLSFALGSVGLVGWFGLALLIIFLRPHVFLPPSLVFFLGLSYGGVLVLAIYIKLKQQLPQKA